MYNRRGQANIIVILGMVAATIFVMFNAFNYINYVGLSSQIEITAQTSISQSLAQKDYLLQQANYLFDKAQLFDAFNLQPLPQGNNAVNCGYINASTTLPFIPVSKVYYWHNLAGQSCLPDNQEIQFGLEQLLNETQFGMVNTSGTDITSYLDLNLTRISNGVFQGTFSAPYLGDTYTITYNSSNAANSAVNVYDNNQNYYVFNGTIGLILNLNGSQFVIDPPSDVVSGVLSQPVATSSFFSGARLAPNAQFSLVTFGSGKQAVIYDNQTINNQHTFFITPLVDPNVYTLSSAEAQDVLSGVSPYIELYNNSVFKYEGTWYNFTVTNYPNGVFSITPVNYTILPIQPQFVYYKYLINEFQTSGSQNILFPNNQQLSVSFSLFPLYNPQVCVSYNKVQFSLTNCVSVSGYITTNDYISNLMQMGVAFVNNSFPTAMGNITGFAQYALYDYLNNAANAVNLKTVSVNGQPKYDWYSAMLLTLGSPNGVSYLMNQLSRVKEQYYGTTIYNCSQNSSDIAFCRGLLSSTVSADLQNLFDYQIPVEVGFMSGTPFNINVLNLSANLSESNSCQAYGGYPSKDYNATVDYSFNIKSSNYTNFSEETIGLPVSISFAYQNELSLTPSEPCGIQNNPYESGYPGFIQTLVSPSQTFLNCAQIQAKQFLNTTCIATVETSDTSVLNNVTSSGGTCTQVTGQNYYVCQGYKFNSLDRTTGYQNWITSGNSCPSSVTIASKNFTMSQSPSGYKLVTVTGGGTVTPTDSENLWSMVSVNGSGIKLPSNISVYTGVSITGTNPTFNLILSQYPNLGEPFSYIQLASRGLSNTLSTYGSSGSSQIASSSLSTPYGAVNNLQLNLYGSKTSGYNLSFYMNGANQLQASNLSSMYNSGTNSLHFVGLSTDNLPSQDSVSYLFVTSYVKGYSPVNTIYSSEKVNSLNKNLRKEFGLSNGNSAYYNIITMNSAAFTNAYDVRIILNPDFNYSEMSASSTEVFGLYSNGTVKSFYWWNQTPMQVGGVLWVNVSRNVPQSLYVVYGDKGASKSVYSDNGSAVFPLFFSNTTGRIPSIFNFENYASSSPVPDVSVGGVTLYKEGAVYPFIYNSTINTYYSQFACVSVKPSLSITMLNATYVPYPQSSNVVVYNSLYPDLQVINSNTYGSWGSMGG